MHEANVDHPLITLCHRGCVRYALISLADAPAMLGAALAGRPGGSLPPDEITRLDALLLRSVRIAELLVAYAVGLSGRPAPN